MNKTVLAIDIGSTKICAIIAEIGESEVIVQGHHIVPSQGVKKGVISNIELASKAIKRAADEARKSVGNHINSAIVSVSNAYSKNLNSTGIVSIADKDISIKEINRVMQTALYNADISNEDEVIHVIPHNFRVDNQDSIEDPYGMHASRLEVDVNIMLTQKSNLSNLKKAVSKAGIDIEDMVIGGYASSIATINEDERELGVAVLDLGGQTSSLIVNIDNNIRYNTLLGVGSNHITNDLTMALHTTLKSAEDIKTKHGNLTPNIPNEIIKLPKMGEESSVVDSSLETINFVISARVEETLTILAKSLKKSNLQEQVGAGIVLTGGMSKLKGIKEFTKTIFDDLPVRIACPNIENIPKQLKAPEFSTVIGLLLYKMGQHTQYETNFQQELKHFRKEEENSLSDIKINHVKEEVPEKNLYSFDDLPDINRESSSTFRKIINKIRQLF